MENGVPYFETGLVTGSTHQAYAYPCSIVQLPDKRLMTTFSGNGGCASYSDDNGRTWTNPVVLFRNDCPFVKPLDAPQNFADPTLVIYKDRIVIYCFSLQAHEPAFWDLSATRTWYRVSRDNGHTWDAIQEMKMHKKYVCGATNAGLRLADGSIVIGYSWEEKAESGLIVPDGEGSQIYHCGLRRTVDEGLTWIPGGDVSVNVRKGPDALTDAVSGADEPAYVQLSDESIYMLVRTGTDHLWETRSQDMGKTWSEPVPSPLISHNCPAALIRLDEGQVLVVYNDHPKERVRLCTRISTDGCQNWLDPKVFAPIGFYEEPYTCYPVLCQLEDGLVVATWCQKKLSVPTDLMKICYARFNLSWLML